MPAGGGCADPSLGRACGRGGRAAARPRPGRRTRPRRPAPRHDAHRGARRPPGDRRPSGRAPVAGRSRLAAGPGPATRSTFGRTSRRRAFPAPSAGRPPPRRVRSGSRPVRAGDAPRRPTGRGPRGTGLPPRVRRPDHRRRPVVRVARLATLDLLGILGPIGFSAGYPRPLRLPLRGRRRTSSGRPAGRPRDPSARGFTRPLRCPRPAARPRGSCPGCGPRSPGRRPGSP